MSQPDLNAKIHQNPPDPLAEFNGPTSKRSGRGGRESKGCSTCLPPRFDNPGYGPGRDVCV